MKQDKNEIKESDRENTVPCEEIKIPVSWGHISGKWWGSKLIQPILSIHGLQDNAGTFDNLAPLLAHDFPILSIDLPGHGFSSHYPKGQYYGFWDGVILIRRIVQLYKWNKVKLMGHSLGGCIAFLYAASYPNETELYISLDIASPCVNSTSDMVSSIGESIDKFLKYENLNTATSSLHNKKIMTDIAYDAYNGSLTREGCEIMMKRAIKSSENSITYCFTRDVRLQDSKLGFMSMDQVMEFASRITCNVLNIKAIPGLKNMNNFAFVNYDVVLDKIKETANYMEVHNVPGAHHLHLNNAKSISGIIRNFLTTNNLS